MTRSTKAVQTPTARSVIAYVDRYLMYSLDEDAKNVWTLAIAKATEGGASLPEAIHHICAAYLQKVIR